MKHNILFSAALLAACTFSMNVNAQLEVQTSGDVELTKNLMVKKDATVKQKLTVKNNVAVGDSLVNDNICLNIVRTSTSYKPYYGVRSKMQLWSQMPNSSIYAICGDANACDANLNYNTGVRHIVGVYGKAVKCSDSYNRFTAGVAGLSMIYGGIGVYGGIATSTTATLPTSMPSGYYAGYFNGTVVTNGSLVSTTLSTMSDMNYYEDVQSLTSKKADIIQALNPVSYTLKADSAWIVDEKAPELQQGVHYGLIAQEVQKVLPELVYERADKLSINYMELIPLLIMKVQELSQVVETQNLQIMELQSKLK